MNNLDYYQEQRATSLDCLPEECPDRECDGHLVFNEWTQTWGCNRCRYREDLDMKQVNGKELV